MGLDAVGALGGLGSLTGEDDKLKRLEAILDILNVSFRRLVVRSLVY